MARIPTQDFTGFTFNGRHSSEFNLKRVSGGDRYQETLVPSLSDRTTEIPGGNGTLFYNSTFGNKEFPVINIAFDSLTETNLRELKQWLSIGEPKELIFDEVPFKKYFAKIASPPSLTYVCFTEDYSETVGGVTTYRTRRIYKGEGEIQFISYFPFARSIYEELFSYRSEVNSLQESTSITIPSTYTLPDSRTWKFTGIDGATRNGTRNYYDQTVLTRYGFTLANGEYTIAAGQSIGIMNGIALWYNTSRYTGRAAIGFDGSLVGASDGNGGFNYELKLKVTYLDGTIEYFPKSSDSSPQTAPRAITALGKVIESISWEASTSVLANPITFSLIEIAPYATAASTTLKPFQVNTPTPAHPSVLTSISDDYTIYLENEDKTKLRTYPIILEDQSGNKLTLRSVGAVADKLCYYTPEFALANGLSYEHTYNNKWGKFERIGTTTLDDNLTWTFHTLKTETGKITCIFFSSFDDKKVGSKTSISTHFTNVNVGWVLSNSTTVPGTMSDHSITDKVFFCYEYVGNGTPADAMNDWKDFLSAQTPTMIYQKAIPTFIPLADKYQDRLDIRNYNPLYTSISSNSFIRNTLYLDLYDSYYTTLDEWAESTGMIEEFDKDYNYFTLNNPSLTTLQEALTATGGKLTLFNPGDFKTGYILRFNKAALTGGNYDFSCHLDNDNTFTLSLLQPVTGDTESVNSLVYSTAGEIEIDTSNRTITFAYESNSQIVRVPAFFLLSSGDLWKIPTNIQQPLKEMNFLWTLGLLTLYSNTINLSKAFFNLQYSYLYF